MTSQKDDRAQRVQEIVRDCLQKWATGERIDDLQVVDENLDLAPELGRELLKLRLLGQAADQAATPETHSEAEDSEAKHMVEPTLGRVGGGGLRVRCPHCRNPLELLDDDSTEMLCDSCGTEISIATKGEANSKPNAKLGCFQLQELLGTGAFGSVWRAHDEELDRDVAIKVPRRNQLDPSQAGQFLREARITAQLAHPNIVTVHEIGREDDTVYIVSDLVQGVPLSQRMKEKTSTITQIATLCETLARALQHAHNKGVVHRDLKPANIMMDEADEPHVMDFGLAKRDVGEITMTADGQVLGTPAYMSPEQAAGDSHRVDGRSDIYSLGVILFELLTGELPFRGSVGMMIQQVIHDEPPSPRRLSANVPRDLETIVLKCLAKDKGSRYPTAEHVGDELQRFLRGQPIKARPIARIDRAWRWSKRNPMAATVVGLVAFLAVVGPCYAWHEYDQRVEIQGLSVERQNMITRLDTNNKELQKELARAVQGFVPAQEPRWNLHSVPIAELAVEKYEKTKAVPSARSLIARGNFCFACQRTDEAIKNWEHAVRLLEPNNTSNAKVAVADCRLKLGEAYLSQDINKAVNSISQARVTLREILDANERPSLNAHALLLRARALLGIALAQTNRQAEGLQLLREAEQHNREFLSTLPSTAEEAYEFSHWFFAKTPPFLAAHTDR